MIRTQAVAKAGTKVSSGATNKVKAKKPARNRAQRPVLAPASIPTALSRIAVEVGVPMKPAPIVAIESEIRARTSPGILPLLSMKPARKDKPIKVDMLSNKSTHRNREEHADNTDSQHLIEIDLEDGFGRKEFEVGGEEIVNSVCRGHTGDDA